MLLVFVNMENKKQCTHKDCVKNATGICEHGKRKAKCTHKDCVKNATAICEHGKRKATCTHKDCVKNATGICEHGKQKARCKHPNCIKNATSICEHGKRKAICKHPNCIKNATAICEHGKQKARCTHKDCVKNATGICEHGKQKAQCKHPNCVENATAICEHKLIKYYCMICTPERACAKCNYVYVGPYSNYKPYCFKCYCVLNPGIKIPRMYKLKEMHMRDELIKYFPTTEFVFDKIVDDGCSRRKPDVRIECYTHSIIIECDENQHKSISYNCEHKRMMELFQDLGNRPIIFIRFNPDSYTDKEGKKHKSCFNYKKSSTVMNKKEWKNRISELVKLIQKYYIEIPEKEVTTKKLFFDFKK